MRQHLAVAVTALTLVLAALPSLVREVASAQEVPELRITSKKYIVIDAETGEIFAQRGAHDRVPLASLTKIFTAIEAIESAPPDRPITTTEFDLVSAEATQMGFGPGETFALDDLLYGMLLPSGNDAARAIARSLGAEPGDASDVQSLERFMARLNARIRNMGLQDTSLVNPDGWGVPNHLSSAYDIAAFTMYALQYPRFVRAISTETYETAGGYALTNTNKLLGHYPGLIGGKTGFDDDAGYCLVQIARRDGSTMISVTLDGVADNGDWYDDNRVLLDYAFERKATRISLRAPITGEVVRYRDPDAVLIAQNAESGASIGEPFVPPVSGGVVRPSFVAEGVGGPALVAAPAAVPANPGSAGRWIVPFLVVAVLIVLRTAAAHRGAATAAARAGPAGGTVPRREAATSGGATMPLETVNVTPEPAP